MIKPTVGRVVHVYRRSNQTGGYSVYGPTVGLVLAVWGDRCINVSEVDANGKSHFHSSLTLRQPEDPLPQASTAWAEWMPYQQEQAAVSDAITRSVNAGAGVAMSVGCMTDGVALRGG
jgi:hypothetical protein